MVRTRKRPSPVPLVRSTLREGTRIKPLENSLKVRRWNTYTSVRHAEDDPGFLLDRKANLDVNAARRIFHGIGQQVHHHGAQLFLVAAHNQGNFHRRLLKAKAGVVQVMQRLHAMDRSCYEFAHINGRAGRFAGALPYFSRFQHLLTVARSRSLSSSMMP